MSRPYDPQRALVLPNDMWMRVFESLPRSSFPAVLGTCKKFLRIGIVLLYSAVTLHARLEVAIHALQTLSSQPSFARLLKVLIIRWHTDDERSADLMRLATPLARVLKHAIGLEKLSVVQLPSIYHWTLPADLVLPKLTHLETNMYLAFNARSFLDSHRHNLLALVLAPEPPGAPTAYHIHFADAPWATRTSQLTRLIVGVLPLAPSLVRAHATSLRALTLADADERWHSEHDRGPLYAACLSAPTDLTHVAFRHPRGLGPIVRGIVQCTPRDSVATVTLAMCPWAECSCLRIGPKDHEYMRSIAALFPSATAFRFFCPAPHRAENARIADAIWPVIAALELERESRPSVRPIAYQGDDCVRGLNAFWHKYQRGVPPSPHPFRVVFPADRMIV